MLTSLMQRYIHLKGIGPIIIPKQIAYTFVEIFVEFIKRRPKSVLELVLKNDAGVIGKSNKFKEDSITIRWNLDMFVHCAVSSFSETD